MSVGAVNKQTGDRIPTAGMPAIDSVLSGSSTNPVQNRVVKAALDEKADTELVASDFDATASYTAGNYCIYEGKFYRFKNNHSGAWAAADVDEIQIAGELSSIKSGLTNYEATTNAALSVPEDSGKNLFSGSFTTTTNGGVTFTANSDGTVSATNTSTGYASVNSTEFTLKKGQYIFSGVPSGNAKYVLALYANNVILSQITNGSSVTINLDSDTALVMRCVINGADVETGVDFEPMIRPSYVTDATFAPYIPSVETRLEAVEKGNVSHEILKSSTSVWSGDTLTFTVAPENNRMWRLVAGVTYSLGTKFVEAYIVIRSANSGIFIYNAHGTVTATYDYTTGVLTVTLPESSHWVYRMELAAVYYD